MSHRLLPIILSALLLVLAALPVAARQTTTPYRIIGYYASWAIYGKEYFVTDIAANQLTHINYAFANISEEGEILIGDEWADTQFLYPGDAEDEPLRGNFKQLGLLKQINPNLQTLISVGGWSWSDRFSDVALTEESRAKFAKSCVEFIKQYGFDGVDLDWEYPSGGGEPGNIERPEDPDNFVLLLAELRKQLDAQGELDGRPYLLTIAAPAGKWQYERMNLDKIYPYLDWINIMTYDYAGGWSEVTAFNAPLYGEVSTDSAIQDYLTAGIPAEKVVMGVPFYGRGWTGVSATNNGLGQPYDGLPQGDGSFDYGTLAADYVGKYQRFWDETAQVPWLYDAESGTMISYDDPESLTKKAEYIKQHNLGGAMFWETSQDDANNSLLNALYTTLNSD
ncbi:MAG: glycoside hydrolase family 18 protein [Anaerolineae bacterium]|nr:glycoside hydrolase family 18 protein [Anaerolineae bacterium]